MLVKYIRIINTLVWSVKIIFIWQVLMNVNLSLKYNNVEVIAQHITKLCVLSVMMDFM